MPMMTSQILKSVYFSKTQKFKHHENESLFSPRIKKLHIKGYFIAKNSFLVEITLEVAMKCDKHIVKIIIKIII